MNLFQQYNPFRDPSWRLERVLELVDHRPRPLRCSRKRDDEYISAYRKFVLNWRLRSTPDQRVQLCTEMPGPFFAHLLYYNQDKERRWIIESRILAGQDNDGIAEAVGTHSDGIEIYERVFFNVRDRLNSRDYIVKTILGTMDERKNSKDGAQTAYQRGMTMKLFAYFGGLIIFELVFGGMSKGNTLPARYEDAKPWWDEMQSMSMRKNASVASQTFEANKYNVMQLFEMHIRMMEMDKAGDSGPDTEYEHNVREMLAGLEWRSGEQSQLRLQQDPLLNDFVNSAVEPRADEMNTIAREGIVPESLKTVRTLQITEETETK